MLIVLCLHSILNESAFYTFLLEADFMPQTCSKVIITVHFEGEFVLLELWYLCFSVELCLTVLHSNHSIVCSLYVHVWCCHCANASCINDLHVKYSAFARLRYFQSLSHAAFSLVFYMHDTSA